MPFVWIEEGKEAFQKIKSAITRAVILRNPDFSKKFILYAYGSNSLVAIILTQKHEKNEEYPIAFFSQTMNNYEEKYTFIEKEVLAILKSLNKLKHYIAQNKVLVLTIHLNVRSYIMQGEIGEGRPGWISKIRKYDVEIRPTKLIRGKALCNQLTKEKMLDKEIIYLIEQEALDDRFGYDANDQLTQLHKYFEFEKLSKYMNASQ